ncbi:pro-thyrotropin-releasing hormone [Latimeria chalumnae]|uniref:pro-thyrotropin-releasing hormone n=1 Tax=Latimeria chalumnae TaxID=7897 RepID=UPI00313D0BFF
MQVQTFFFFFLNFPSLSFSSLLSLTQEPPSATMRSAGLLLLLVSLGLSSMTAVLGQHAPEGVESEESVPMDDLLQQAESILLRSILKKMEEEKDLHDPTASQVEWISKRQHPGKRDEDEEIAYIEAQKRQHPGKRGGEEENDNLQAQKRQHPGKRDDAEDDDGDEGLDEYTEVQKRQHPGRRSTLDQFTDSPNTQLAFLSELSKRQHPGKRYLLYNKRQHPGKRGWDKELDYEDLQELEKRQHPGKRQLPPESPDYGLPCDILDPINCSKTSLLLELLDNVSKGKTEEKRQHPGRRFTWEGEATDQE